ncbi:unnamed protein product [Prorocentrum cordatum]|uniref:Nudix hydrolase domain-containing protein n=1 Tax=Prorocentrum cordatum TaxID=2364126 RepID=A0ABN9XHY0_9DINO|nr:unnamed protein product [Polarella glacialis]
MRLASRGGSRPSAAAGEFDGGPAAVAPVVVAGVMVTRLRGEKIPEVLAFCRVGGSDPVWEFPTGRLELADGSKLGCAFRELAEETGVQLEVPPGGCVKLGVGTYSTGRGRRGGPGALKEVHWYQVAAGGEGRWGPREARAREVRFMTKRELRAAAVKGRFSLYAEEALKLATPKATEPVAGARPKRKAPRGSAGREALPGRKGGAGAGARREELRGQEGRPRAASDVGEEATDVESSVPTLLDEVEAELPWRAAGEAGLDVELQGGLAGVEAESFEGGGVPAFAGVADVKDAFHMLIMPVWLSRYFGLPDALVAGAGAVGQVIDGAVAVAGDAIAPLARALPAGFAWSLFFCQRIGESLLGQRAPAPRASEPLRGRGRPAVLVLNDGLHELGHCARVDNLGATGDGRSQVGHALADAVKVFKSFSLLVRGEEARGGAAEALGVVLDGESQRTRLTKKRRWRLHSALRSNRGRASGAMVEVILGHCAFCGLVRRLALSLFHPVCKFIALISGRCGCGVSASLWSDEEAKAAGRAGERGRFRGVRAAQARGRALTAAGVRGFAGPPPPAEAGLPGGDFDGPGAAMVSGEYVVNPSFPEVASAGLARGRWGPRFCGAWKWGQPTLVLEARALAISLRSPAAAGYPSAAVERPSAEIGAGVSARGAELKGSSGCGSTAGKTPLANLDGELAVPHRRRDCRARQAADPARRDRERAARACGRDRVAGQAAGAAESDSFTSSGCSLELCRESGDDGQRAKSALGRAAGSAAVDATRAHNDKAAEIAAMAEPAKVAGVPCSDPLKAGRSDGGRISLRLAESLAGSVVATLDSADRAQAIAAQIPETGGASAVAAPPQPIAGRPTGRLRGAARRHPDARAERASSRGLRRHLSLGGRYFACVFCGKGVCGRSAELAGFQARCFDLVNGDTGDVFRPEVINGLIADMQAGEVIGMKMGPPCAMFSIAKHRSKTLWTQEAPMDVPDLRRQDTATVKQGNRLMRFAARLARERRAH